MDALRVGREIEALKFLWYEEPLPHYDIQGYVELSRDLEIPVIGAETIIGSVYSAALYLRANALDMIECDVYWKGGITGMLKIAHLCEAMGVKVASHHGASALMNLANLHTLCGIRNADFIEVLVPEENYNYGLKSPLRVDPEGYMTVPQHPGLGAEMDWDYIKSHTTGEL
jgi:L-alanine-DL-glutamate epimerase-like enolase superfamily enzyme